MQLFSLEHKKIPLCLALGFFDCLHYGHKKLVKRAIEMANEIKISSAVTTFSNNPFEVLSQNTKLVNTFDERKILFEEMGVDFLLPIVFDEEFKEMTADQFLDNLLSKCNIAALVCGYDYTFGKNREGDIEKLILRCKENSVKLEIIEQVNLEDERVSSTIIRNHLAQGNISKASFLLTKPYFVMGTVERGKGIGKAFGMPTANISINKDKCVLKNGVYATTAIIEGVRYKAVTNYGDKPTFDDESFTIETFIDGIESELYGKTLILEFISYIRPTAKFITPLLLADQVQNDLAARKLLD